MAEKREQHAGALPVVSARSELFTIAGGEEPPSVEDILAQIESDELLQLEMEDRAKVSGRRPMALASDTTCSTPRVETSDDADLCGGLPVISRSAIAAKLLQQDDDVALPPPCQELAEEAPVPGLDDLLKRLDLESGSSDIQSVDLPSNSEPSHWEAERRLSDAVQVHPDQQMWSYETLIEGDRLRNPQMISDMRATFDSQFQHADSIAEASHRSTRQPKAARNLEPCAEEADPETYSGYMHDLLRGPQKKPARPTAKDAKLLAKPPAQRTEALPGVRMAGAKKPAKKTGNMDPKKIEAMKKMLRHANAGGSLDTLFEEDDDDPDCKIPDCDLLFGGRALRCTSAPQIFTCVPDAQRDDWIHVPR